ncbi:ATP synthase E chain-domain-containing protein, partial [Butyriboletus roseoflavus]
MVSKETPTCSASLQLDRNPSDKFSTTGTLVQTSSSYTKVLILDNSVFVMSSTLNVARYTALASGIVYGIYHHRSLQKAHDQEKEHHAVHRREQLIVQAKDAWRQKSAKGDGVITDPEDPRFDLEKLFAKWEKEYQ